MAAVRGGPIRCVGFSPDGSNIVSGDAEGNVVVWEGAEGV